MKHIVPILMALLFTTTVKANDGAFYVNGSTLVPVKETEISISKEVLTITIGKDSYATVDVYYEFFNPKAAKTVTMAFEADAPYNTSARFNKNGIHPFIKDFTVTMNSAPLQHENAVIARPYGQNRHEDFTPLNMEEWKGYGDSIVLTDGEIYDFIDEDELLIDDDAIYNEKLDSATHFAYGYFFIAEFKKGLNTVHHTYSYHMSDNIYTEFEVPYWLTPATRWAGGKIGDFTLRIKSESVGTDVCMEDSLFMGKPWKINSYQYFFTKTGYKNIHYMLAALHPEKALEWHAEDFVPDRNIVIYSADFIKQHFSFEHEGKVVVDDTDGNVYIYLGEDDKRYFVETQDYGWVDKSKSHVDTYRAENGQGSIIVKDYKSVNVREEPTTSSSVIYTIKEDIYRDIPAYYDCKGLKKIRDDEGLYEWWFKINVDGKEGYVRSDLVDWHPLFM